MVSDADESPKSAAVVDDPVERVASSLEGVRVLVVEDERDTRAMLRRVLEKRGAVVRTAATASEAIALLSVEPFNVLLSDIGLPGEDGYTLIKKVRELPAIHGGSVPAIALTAYGRSEDRKRAITAGFHMHLAKPVEVTELVVVVQSMARIRPIRTK